MDTWIDRWKDRGTKGRKDGQTGEYTDRQANRLSYEQIDRQSGRWTD
jgi:hypothetical protein